MQGTPIPAHLEQQVFHAVEDEQIVNFALVLLLDTLALLNARIKGFWSPFRSPMTVRAGAGTGAAAPGAPVYQARVDGVFRDSFHGDGKMIVEVKPFGRGEGRAAMPVQMQESAQMAAWIAQHPWLPNQERTKATQ